MSKIKNTVRRMIILQTGVMCFFMVFTLTLSMFNLINVRNEIINTNLSALYVSQNQLENYMDRLDDEFLNYWVGEPCHSVLRSVKKTAPRESYFLFEADAITWMNKLLKYYDEVDGVFIFYENIRNPIFRDRASNKGMRELFLSELESGNRNVNHYCITEVDGNRYIYIIKNTGTFYGGVWINVEKINDSLSFAGYPGDVFLCDRNGNLALNPPEEEDRIKEISPGHSYASGKEKKYLYSVEPQDRDIFLMMTIPAGYYLKSITPLNLTLLAIDLILLALIPAITMWQHKRIAEPMNKLDEAMQRIGEGNIDYRIEINEGQRRDEFDRLMLSFNRMMDEINELEYNLYESKLKEQQTELKYISHQIRPHFILNALNVIYTYNENEFPLVKKMVMYLVMYFRYIVNLHVDFVELEKELTHIENYLNIQKERYLDRFDFFVEWEVDVNSVLIPPLIIQTFVENCVKYGMNSEDCSFIFVLASREGEFVKLMIADTGSGFDEEHLALINEFLNTREHVEGLGVGIENAVQRMGMLYGYKVRVEARNQESGGARIEIYLPYNFS